jgi:Zn-dependent peptidase ImmA (M78 family)
MANGPLSIPDRSYEELRGIARCFLAEHDPNGAIPVPVEEIIEFRLGLNIIPMPGLRRHFDIEGYVSKDLGDISVDQYIQESKPDHYRYVLAHELAHVLIHGDVVTQFEFDSIEAWKSAIMAVRQEERSVYDGQAHELGSLILVPPAMLAAEFGQCRRQFEVKGLTLEQVCETERGRIIVENNLARRFDVPRFVITDRMNRDRLWSV